MSILNKIIISKQNRWSKSLSSVGSIIGLVIILISVQIYIDIQEIVNNNPNTITSDYLVLSKKIAKLSFLSKEKSHFTEKDIQDLQKADFVEDMAAFNNCNYEVMIEIGNQKGNIPGLHTLAFFESIPVRFLDTDTDFSTWDNSNNEVPLILPKNYLDAYNYGLAMSMNTPQLNEDLIKNLRFKIHIKGNNTSTTYIGKVSGLSSRINSILVPEPFLELTNKIYGTTSSKEINRVIISTNNPNNPTIVPFLEDHQLTSNSNLHNNNIIKQIIRGVFSYQLIIAMVIIIQGLLLLIFYSRMILFSSKKTIERLFLIGYLPITISKAFERNLYKSYALIFITSLVVTNIVNIVLANQINKYLQIKTGIILSPHVFVIWGALFFLFILINQINLRKKLHQML